MAEKWVVQVDKFIKTLQSELSKNGLNIDFTNVVCRRGLKLVFLQIKGLFYIYTPSPS